LIAAHQVISKQRDEIDGLLDKVRKLEKKNTEAREEADEMADKARNAPKITER